MRPKCHVCGKLFWCDYPNLWRYKREKTYLCSWSCLRKYDERKEAKNMAYSKIRKDGTPAKKPGGKKTAAQALQELKEDFAEKGVELVYDPEIAEEYRREQEQKKANEEARKEATERTCRILGQEPLEVASLKSRVLNDGYYRKNRDGTGMYLEGGSMEKEVLGLGAGRWIRFSAEILLALEQLGVREEAPEDCTGNNGPL